MSRLGELWDEERVVGRWPFEGLPPEVRLAEGTFRRALWRLPKGRIDGRAVVAQYREERDDCSRHLLVLEGGFYSIDHFDVANPDRVGLVSHLWHDGGARRVTRLATAVAAPLLSMFRPRR